MTDTQDPALIGADPNALDAAGSLAAGREAQTSAQVFDSAVGNLFGDSVKGLLGGQISTDRFISLGENALNSAISKLASSVSATAAKGSVLDKLNMDLLSSDLKAELMKAAKAYMTTGEGAVFASSIADKINEDPRDVIAALILAGALAYATNMTIPQIHQKMNLGGGFSAALNAQLGTLKHVALADIGAELDYAAGPIKAAIKYDRLTGDAARNVAGNESTGGKKAKYVGGSVSPDVVDQLGASINVALGTGSSLDLSGRESLAHGRSVSGTISAKGNFTVDNDWKLGAGVDATHGANAGVRGSLSATYKPDENQSLSLSVTDQFSGKKTGVGVDFKYMLDGHDDRYQVMVEGKYDHSTGGWAGVVVKIPF